MIHVAVLGYGTVGSGVVEVIENNLEEIIEQNNVKDTLQFLPDEINANLGLVFSKNFWLLEFLLP